jgi:hypothetical protein
MVSFLQVLPKLTHFENYAADKCLSFSHEIFRFRINSIRPSVALQPFFGTWPLSQFRILIHSRYESLERGSGGLKAATYTQNNTNTE